ncbi:Protein interacting with Hsp90 1 [Nakaseomyces bracarensis]|uniref:Protein interacting with Hsp90 1 n=1 Tax=Nakaseomyces bracarensis TaxID=273131 RepID=A0ABR4P0S3_9SACH
MDFLLRPIGGGDSGSSSVTVLKPQPSLVIKSKIVNVDDRPRNLPSLEADRKVFINLCHDDNAPKPDIPFDANIVYPMIMNNKWEIPIVTSSFRVDHDKKGQECYVVDCCVNSECLEWIAKDYQLKDILVEWCLEAAELRETVEISRDSIAFPKMKKKGDSIPDLEVFSEELDNNYMNDMIEKDSNSEPTSILKARRDLLIQEEEMSIDNSPLGEQLPPLFPGQTTRKKSLIEEIDDLSIQEKPKPSEKVRKSPISYDVTMRKVTTSDKFKLRIDIKIEPVESSLDLNLSYDSTNNDLVLRNLNIHICEEKILKIPLPNIFDRNKVLNNADIYFVKNKKTVTILI